MAASYPTIDYTDLLEALTADIESNYITDESKLNAVRQAHSVFCEALGSEVYPVIDYFYDKPALEPKLRSMTVLELKKLCFDAIDRLKDSDEPGSEGFTETVKLITDELSSYTKGASNRNSRTCMAVFTEVSEIPVMVYFDDSDASPDLQCVRAVDFITELKKSNGTD